MEKLTSKLLEGRRNESEDSVDFEKADLSKLSKLIDSRIQMKSPNKQAELYEELSWKLMNLIKDVPAGETKLRSLLKDFKSEYL